MLRAFKQITVALDASHPTYRFSHVRCSAPCAPSIGSQLSPAIAISGRLPLESQSPSPRCDYARRRANKHHSSHNRVRQASDSDQNYVFATSWTDGHRDISCLPTCRGRLGYPRRRHQRNVCSYFQDIQRDGRLGNTRKTVLPCGHKYS